MFESEKPRLELSDRQRVEWLRLIRTENIGPVTFRRLLNRFGSAEAVLSALPDLTRNAGRKAPLTAPSVSQIEDELAAIHNMGARTIAMGEPDFPDLLTHSAAAPPMLTIQGNGTQDWSRTVGIVGARNASAAGQRICKTIAAELDAAGFLTISGLARGIDTAAHSASLSSGTIAVLAGGLDKIYPPENIELANQIIANGGALISEMPMGWEPRARDFPRRNRLVSGLSLGVVIIEAAKRSGSLITARLALEQNREVFAVPGNPMDPRAEGPNSLIRDGATLVTKSSHIIEALSTADPRSMNLFEDHADAQFTPQEPNEQAATESDRKRLLSALSPTPTQVDDLVQTTGLSARLVQTLLMDLELDGQLEWASGQLVSLRQ
jgi:DNA processing protein